jgi:hypothetical protein
MKNVLTIDPGKVTGWAYWKQLTKQKFAPKEVGTVTKDHYRELDTLINLRWMPLTCVFIEGQELRSDASSYASAKSGVLLELAQQAGWYAGICWSTHDCTVEFILPSKWKGQLSKKQLRDRVEKIAGEYFTEHIADAVGMGLYLVGKL